MLQIVGDDADQTHGQRDRRVPTLVDDPSEVIVGETTDELGRAGGHGRVVAGQELSRGDDPTGLVRALAVSDLIDAEGEREPFGPSLLAPHLSPVEGLRQMVVLDAAEVPYQPGDRVGLPVGPPSKDLVIGTVEDAFHLVAYPIECIGQISRTVFMRALCPSGTAVACVPPAQRLLVSLRDSGCLCPSGTAVAQS